ncbi:hypothetical protein SDC9_06197 [bioreactor metagenome]|uniref:Uncharacterized protein n=1 Tax=bioreactor metagenome TaxID=1076179 RepID=A0A644T1A4_9ZZZZ|nr:hypothetical protein [Negativicutes bacterium]
MAKGIFRGFINNKGIRYAPDEFPDAVKHKLAKLIIDNYRQKKSNFLTMKNH